MDLRRSAAQANGGVTSEARASRSANSSSNMHSHCKKGQRNMVAAALWDLMLPQALPQGRF